MKKASFGMKNISKHIIGRAVAAGLILTFGCASGVPGAETEHPYPGNIKEKAKKEQMSVSIIGGADGPTSIFWAGTLEDVSEGNEEEDKYVSVPTDVAEEIIEGGALEEYVILDVRREEEFAQGHIPGAINIPNETIENEVLEELPDMDAIIFVYCRSGRRSKEAAEKMAEIGYQNIIEMGGIMDWTGEIEK